MARDIIDNYIKDNKFSGAQCLENAAVSVPIDKGLGNYGKINLRKSFNYY